ncbi:MAG TPA: FTR1 family protein [Candidatus Binataceae bacterium]|jgi:high-affinity iron transporter|nr:FTR1 family protein [Candidatus Binataceae bacterium]
MSHTAVPYFIYSAGILFREGLEALLVVIALVAGTREAGADKRAKDIYAGALIAIAASIALAWGVNHLISDDASDTLEGVFQVLAAATLFYVSSWLTSKSQAHAWNSFIKDHVRSAQESSVPGLALGLTAFLAVIREGAETIVFFQALTVGATETIEKHAVWVGIAVAGLALAVTFLVLNRAAHRIPIGRFFQATSILLYALAVVFIGQGIASFQESEWIAATFVDHVPTIPMLGLYPTVQSIVAQLALIAFAAAALLIPRGSASAAAPARDVSPHPVRPS